MRNLRRAPSSERAHDAVLCCGCFRMFSTRRPADVPPSKRRWRCLADARFDRPHPSASVEVGQCAQRDRERSRPVSDRQVDWGLEFAIEGYTLLRSCRKLLFTNDIRERNERCLRGRRACQTQPTPTVPVKPAACEQIEQPVRTRGASIGDALAVLASPLRPHERRRHPALVEIDVDSGGSWPAHDPARAKRVDAAAAA